ncbi:hypothetical protein ACJX0J_008166, partial [Zea mays]
IIVYHVGQGHTQHGHIAADVWAKATQRTLISSFRAEELMYFGFIVWTHEILTFTSYNCDMI